MKKKLCLVKGIAGLGNRLCTIASAIDYSIVTNRKLYVDWRDGMYGPKGENVFYSYFKINANNITDNISEYVNEENTYPKNYDFSPSYISEHYEAYLGKTKNRLFRIPHITPASPEWVDKNNKCIEFLRGENVSYFRKENVVVYSDYCPSFRKKNMSKIRIKQDFVENIDRFIEQNTLDGNYIAAHIRATDKTYDTSIKSLYTLIDKSVSRSSDVRIFLATDSGYVQKMFEHRYSNQMFSYPKKMPSAEEWKKGIHHWNRIMNDDEEKIKQFEAALADMLILTKARLLFYQKNSSFSRVVTSWRDKLESIDWTEA